MSPQAAGPGVNGVEVGVLLFFFIAVTLGGFFAARWRRPASMASLDEWGLGGRGFGTLVTWFLLGGDLYTAYTFVAVPAAMYATGAVSGWFAVPEPGLRGGIRIERDNPERRGSSTTIDVDDYDAADPVHRKAITMLDQAVHGADQDVLPACVAVVEQLWADEPVQVWQAAGRLSAAGVPRRQAIRRLAQLWQRCDAADPAGYVAALESVGRPGVR